ncbi:hypothetical protein [Nitrosomonas communis]|uniref:hypothetical protein n=1 Tax=Nitrosomonas communis TaxID=44574 RepID=UPI003D2D8846
MVGLLSKTELSKKYAGEYNSWRDAKYRCKKQKLGVFDPRFNDFTDFLRILGPKPGKDYTLDRIDHSNPEYSPGNTRWASKQLQSINRRNIRYLTNANTGEKLPLTVWAQKLNIPSATIRSRLAKGWSEHQALYGLTSAAVKTHNPVKTQTMGDVWKSYVPHLDSDQVESNYQRSRIQISRSSQKFESRISWLYRKIYWELHALYEEIHLVHNPEEPERYPVTPQLHEKYMRGDALLESIRLRMSAREIEIAHLKIRNLI